MMIVDDPSPRSTSNINAFNTTLMGCCDQCSVKTLHMPHMFTHWVHNLQSLISTKIRALKIIAKLMTKISILPCLAVQYHVTGPERYLRLLFRSSEQNMFYNLHKHSFHWALIRRGYSTCNHKKWNIKMCKTSPSAFCHVNLSD